MYSDYYLLIGFVLQMILVYLVFTSMDFYEKFKKYCNSKNMCVPKLFNINNDIIEDFINECIMQYSQKGNIINIFIGNDIRKIKNLFTLFFGVMLSLWAIFLVLFMISSDINCKLLILLMVLFIIVFVIINLNNIKKFLQIKKAIKHSIY